MGRLTSGSGGSGDSGGGLDASEFIEGNDIQFLKLLSSILGGFVALFAAVWLEAMDVFVSIHVWMIDGLGRFLERVVLETLGAAAATQTAAWREAFVSFSTTPMMIPFVIAVEAFVLYAAFAWVRSKGVIP